MLGNIVFVEVILYPFSLLDQISMNASQASRQDGSYSVSGKLNKFASFFFACPLVEDKICAITWIVFWIHGRNIVNYIVVTSSQISQYRQLQFPRIHWLLTAQKSGCKQVDLSI